MKIRSYSDRNEREKKNPLLWTTWEYHSKNNINLNMLKDST